MALLAQVGTYSIGIQHKVTANNQFDGTLPVGALTFANGMNKYAAGTAGGLFDFENTEPIIITQYHFEFGDVTTGYVLSIITTNADESEISGEASILAQGSAKIVIVTGQRLLLTAGQKLKLVTTGGTAAMFARVFAIQERGYQG